MGFIATIIGYGIFLYFLLPRRFLNKSGNIFSRILGLPFNKLGYKNPFSFLNDPYEETKKLT